MEKSINQPNHKTSAFLIIALYIIARMVAEPVFWSHISIYCSYIFETLFVIGSWFVLRPVLSRQPFSKNFCLILLATFCTGLVIHHMTKTLDLVVPFDFASVETLFLLLIVAPLLEEAIFRMALWEAVFKFTQNKYVLIAVTSFLFMAGHLSAYWFVPSIYKGFVLYQSAYVILLGILLGYVRIKTSSLNAPVLVHWAFNFGFLVAARAWV